MPSCGCSKHALLTTGVEFKTYKLSSKKFKQVTISKLRESGLLGPYTNYLCTVCAKYADENVEEPPCKRAKMDKISTDFENVLNKVNNGVLSESETLELATALGRSIQSDIFEETLSRGTEYQSSEYLKNLNIHEYVESRNSTLTTFIKAATSFEECKGENREKKLLYIANGVDCIYRARNLPFIGPLPFASNVLSYCATGSKSICVYNNKIAASGSYQTVRNWLAAKRSIEYKSTNVSSDSFIFFDNNQVISKNWRVTYNYKGKASVVTTVLQIIPASHTRLQYSPELSPFRWLYAGNAITDVVNAITGHVMLHLREYNYIRNMFIQERIRKVYGEQSEKPH